MNPTLRSHALGVDADVVVALPPVVDLAGITARDEKTRSMGGRRRKVLSQRRQVERPTERLPWYPWYVSQWLSLSRGWPLVARGLARELLDAQWDRGMLPAPPAKLRALVNATPDEWRQAWPFVATMFPVAGSGRQDPQLAALRVQQHEKYERQRAAAERTNQLRAQHGDRGGDRSGDRRAYRDGERVAERDGDCDVNRDGHLNGQRDAIRIRNRRSEEVVHRGEDEDDPVLVDTKGPGR